MTTFDYDFVKLFAEKNGGPIIYNGQTLIMADRIPARLGDVLVVTIESTSSRYPQGIGISEGVEIYGERVKRAVVWEYFSVPLDERAQIRSRLPFSFEVTSRNKSGFVKFYNMVKMDNGAERIWNYAMAMIAEDIPRGRRYRCNDWQPNDDFDDIVFRVEAKTAA